MARPGWFENEDGDGLDEIQGAFLDVLQVRAATWPAKPRDTRLLLPDYLAYGYPLAPGEGPSGKLLVLLDVTDPVEHVVLLTIGAYLDRTRVRGDTLHNQLFTLPALPTGLALDATGTPEELAARTADWFEALLRRPIVRHGWQRPRKARTSRWVFADSGQPLVEGRTPTEELGTPDRVVHVRGDLP